MHRPTSHSFRPQLKEGGSDREPVTDTPSSSVTSTTLAPDNKHSTESELKQVPCFCVPVVMSRVTRPCRYALLPLNISFETVLVYKRGSLAVLSQSWGRGVQSIAMFRAAALCLCAPLRIILR